jgi:putative oxidoreductase
MKSSLLFVGRILMSALFLVSVYWHGANWHAALKKMAATGIMYPELILSVATLFLLFGGLSLLLGYRTRIGICLLLIDVLFSACAFHPFWKFTGAEMELALLAFLSKIALCGGLLFLASCGPGAVSLDALVRGKKN